MSRGAPEVLLVRYHATRDPALRQELVAEFMPLARHLARRYRHTSEPMDDLVQVASVGLLKAIDRFDPGHGTAFSSYAVPTILGELRRYFRDRTWSIHVPRDVQERVLKVERVRDRLCTTLGRLPTTADIAAEIGATSEQVVDAIEAAHMYRPISINRLRDPDDESGELAAFIGTEDEGYAHAEAAATLGRLLAFLSVREREVLHLRFHEDLTQTQIAERIGTSQMQVSRIIRGAIVRLRAAADMEQRRAA